MGYQLEMNWYLVLKENDIIPADEIFADPYYTCMKSGFRVYPIGAVVPIIIDSKAVGLAHIRQTSHFILNNEGKTAVEYDQILSFKDNDPVGNHYTDMYLAYKKKQEREDHGGKFKLADWVNALDRRNFEEALAKLEAPLEN